MNNEKSNRGKESSHRVGRTASNIVFGICGCLIGGLLLIRGFFMLLDVIINRSDPAGSGYQFGGVVVMFILGAAILNWGVN